MALKSAQQESEKAEVIEEALDTLDSMLDRVKVLYEQYFLGIQKQPPQFLHADVERKLRDLAQLQIRNTALRYRFVTLQQKFGSYNNYWRRTLREIESGRYHRSLSRVTRHAAATGAEIPYEILAQMPKRMREQVRRDREAQLALQRHRDGAGDDAELLTLVPLEDEDGAGFVNEPTDVRRAVRAHSGAYSLDDSVSDADIDAYFRQVEAEEEASAAAAADPVARSSEPASQRAGASATVRAASIGVPVRAASPALGATRASANRPPISDSAASRDARPPPAQPAADSPARSTEAAPAQPVPRSRQAWPSGLIDTSPGIGPFPASSAQRPSAGRAATEPPAASPEPPELGQSEAERPGSGQPGAERSTSGGPAGSTGAGAALPKLPPLAPSQQARPNPIAPGSSVARPAATVEAMAGPFPREAPPAAEPEPPSPPAQAASQPGSPGASPTPRPTPPVGVPTSRPAPPVGAPPTRPTPPVGVPTSRPAPAGASPPSRPTPPSSTAAAGRPPEPRQPPPPGMTEADVDALYARYVQAKQMIGEPTGPSSFRKLMKTINAQAPKIMEEYRAKGVDFAVVIKDNQVIIRAKPKM